MTATDKLRRLLDERGVEYRASHSGYVIEIGPYITAFANPTKTTVDVSLFRITPEQAITAALGRGTCHIVMISPGWWECDECANSIDWDSCDPNDPPSCNFCPNCGREVVE